MSEPGRKPRVTDEEILAIFEKTTERVLSTAEVGDALPIKRRATLKRLKSLAEDGQIESKPIGQRNRVWWMPEDATGERSESDSDGKDEPQKGVFDY